MGTIDIYGTIHIKWRQTSKKNYVAIAIAQCERGITVTIYT